MSDDERDLDLDSDEDGSGTGSGFSSLHHGQDKRAHHNALERKRRDHIKDSFTGLKDAIPTLQVSLVTKVSKVYMMMLLLHQGDKSSRAQILKKASEYIAFMRRKNGSHSNDIEDLKRQNNHLENQIKTLEKAKSTGHFATAASILHSAEMDKEEEGETAEESGGEGRREEGESLQPGQSLLLERGEPMMKKVKL